MRGPILVAALAFSVPVTGHPAYGGWGPAGCLPPLLAWQPAPVWGGPLQPLAPPAPAAAPFEWREYADGERDWVMLWQGGRQVGSWSRARGFYRPLHADGTFGPPGGDPPAPVPDAFKVAPPGAVAVSEEPNFGIGRGLIPANKTWLNGREVELPEAFQAVVAAGTIPDDAGHNDLVLVGRPVDTAPVAKDVASHPALAPWKGKVTVQEYEPGRDGHDWLVRRNGYPATGTPYIAYQNAKGRVLAELTRYDGPEKLAKALAEADNPSVKPPPGPGPSPSPGPAPAPTGSAPWWLPWAVAAAMLLLVVVRQRTPTHEAR